MLTQLDEQYLLIRKKITLIKKFFLLGLIPSGDFSSVTG